ncbi:hypothetical protein BOX15_Mlig033999g1 [Macrostomum lignano]|nr:hypothetical protein BOX15_Mlig033999g1 [Macrostomum lignano]
MSPAAACDSDCGGWLSAASLADVPDAARRFSGRPVISKRTKSMATAVAGQDPRLERLLLSLRFNYSQAGGQHCDWLGRAMEAWDSCEFCAHLPDRTDKKYLYLAGMFPGGKRFSNERITKKVAEEVGELNWGNCSGQPKCRLSDLGYHIELVNGAVDCDKSAELGFYISTLLQPKKQPLLGVIGATCSDTIEPVVEASNNFQTVVISPTVESQVYSDTSRYPYFYRTIPSYEPYSDTITSYLNQRKWDTIGLLVRNKMFLNKTAFLDSGTINVCHEEVIEEERLSYKQALKNLKSMRREGCQVLAMDYFDRGTCLYLCAAAELDMTPDNNYLFILAHWSRKIFLSGQVNGTEKVNCSQYLPGLQETHCPHSKLLQPAKQHLIVKNYINVTSAGSGQRHEHSLDEDYFHSYASDAVSVLANSVALLIEDDPSSTYHFSNARVVNSYLAKINSTDFPSEMARDAHNVSFNDLHNVRSGSMMVYLHQYSGDKLGFTSQQLFRYNWETFQNGSMKNTTNFKEFKSNFKFIERLARESCGWNDFIRTLLRMPDLDCQKVNLIFTFSVIIFFIILVVVVAVVGFRYVNHQQMKRQMFLDEPLMELKQRLADIEVPRDRVSVNRKLGEGAFGIVLGGEVQLKNQWIPCALKSLRDTASNSEKCTFLSEATLMRQFKHSNIVCLLAVSTQEEPFYAIMEMCLHGDLKTYLISRRVHAREPGEFSASLPTTLTNFAIDIAKGLEYLHGVKYIHRDVALRNCLVTDKLTIKICDFGLAREVSDKKDYYRFDRRGMLPVRWMSPEAIQYGLFTYKSDVWSYAIVLYEIVTFGKFPYGSRSNEEVCDAVKRGDTLLEHLPVDVNPLLRNLMACCWSFEHDKRPTMTDVAEELARHPGCVAACLEEAPPSQPLDYLGFRRINRDDKLRGSSGSVRSVTNSTKRPQQSVEQLNKLNSTSSHSLAAAYVASSTAAKAQANDLRGQQTLQLRRNNSGLPMEAIKTARSDASMRLLSEL